MYILYSTHTGAVCSVQCATVYLVGALLGQHGDQRQQHTERLGGGGEEADEVLDGILPLRACVICKGGAVARKDTSSRSVRWGFRHPKGVLK